MKIQIESDEGVKIDIDWGKYLFHRDREGQETFYEWEHLTGNEAELKPIFAHAEKMIKQIQDFLPRKPLSALR